MYICLLCYWQALYIYTYIYVYIYSVMFATMMKKHKGAMIVLDLHSVSLRIYILSHLLHRWSFNCLASALQCFGNSWQLEFGRLM